MAREQNRLAFSVALGGMMAAVAVVIMCLVGIIPVATYVCPMGCILILDFVRRQCGNRIAWAWWIAVAILSILLGPDKEAAFLFLFLGYYPILRPKIEGLKLKILVKLALFNGSILLMYRILITVLGMEQLLEEFGELGSFMMITTLVMGNVTFFLLDIILKRGLPIGRKRR